MPMQPQVVVMGQQDQGGCKHNYGTYEEKVITVGQWVWFVILLLFFWPAAPCLFCCDCEAKTTYCNSCKNRMHHRDGKCCC